MVWNVTQVALLHMGKHRHASYLHKAQGCDVKRVPILCCIQPQPVGTQYVMCYTCLVFSHRAVRDMLARGVSDPYCRFITPEEFATMKKYDVTGVGLNLGTAEEYIKKTVSLH